jgi:large subunit ribosomal protein L4
VLSELLKKFEQLWTDFEMIKLPVYSTEGQEIESLSVDESTLGRSVRYPLLKQAIVMYHANRRVGTAATKNRALVAGSNRKLYRQKGTGSARAGTRRTGKRVGGGVTFIKVTRDFGKRMPKKQRRLARDSAILAKLLSDNIVVVDKLVFKTAKTRDFVDILKNLKIGRSCLVTISDYNRNIYRSAKNIPKVDVMSVAELNAGAIFSYHKMLFTKDALSSFLNRDTQQRTVGIENSLEV